MDNRRNGIIVGVIFGVAVAVAAAVSADQGGPVYMAVGTVPVAGGRCTGPRVQLETGNPSKTWCCVSGVWANCTPTGSGSVATSTPPILGDGSVGSPISCRTASGAQSGCLSSANWTTFNSKLSGVVVSPPLNSDGGNPPVLTLSTPFAEIYGGSGTSTLTCASGNALTSNGTNYSCTSTLAASSLALTATPSACSANTWATGINTDGSAACSSIPINSLASPTASKNFAMGTYSLSFSGTAPSVPPLVNIASNANYSGDIFAVTATSSNENTLVVAHFYSSLRAIPLVLTASSSTYPAMQAYGSVSASSFVGDISGTSTFATTAGTIASTLPINKGGTNSTATPTSGGVGYGTGTAHAYTAAGSSGQVLTSVGAAAPVWKDRTVTLAADWNGTSTVATPVLTLGTMPANGYMEFNCILATDTAATSTGLQLGLSAATSTAVTPTWFVESVASSTADTYSQKNFQAINTCPSTCTNFTANVNSPGTTRQIARVSGVVANTSSTNAVTLYGKSNGATNVFVRKGSHCNVTY